MSGPTEHEPTRTEPTRTGLAESFDATAAAYELGRPEYPDAVLDWWDERGAFEPGHAVLDLAAGTGKLTRLLPIVCELHAVEPLANMRHEFAVAVPDVDVLNGTAEQIPYPDNTFDTVLVAQAFHWFDQDVALAEIARVLKPGGGLGLVWNEDDGDAAPWLAKVVDEKRRVTASASSTEHSVVEVLARHDAYGAAEQMEHRWEFDTTIERVLADVLSHSYVSSLPPEQCLAVLTRTRESIEAELGTGVESVVYPYRAVAFWVPTAE
jgi:ubiquinone/menaquinone biosynthesis C-methylase UbiE